MKKYVSVMVEEVRECAYCDYKCDYEGSAYSRWGLIDIWRCPKHGKFEICAGSLDKLGDQIR